MAMDQTRRTIKAYSATFGQAYSIRYMATDGEGLGRQQARHRQQRGKVWRVEPASASRSSITFCNNNSVGNPGLALGNSPPDIAVYSSRRRTDPSAEWALPD